MSDGAEVTLANFWTNQIASGLELEIDLLSVPKLSVSPTFNIFVKAQNKSAGPQKVRESARRQR
jgi:hypothetical protein